MNDVVYVDDENPEEILEWISQHRKTSSPLPVNRSGDPWKNGNVGIILLLTDGRSGWTNDGW